MGNKYYVKKFNSLYEYNEYLRHGKVQSAFSGQSSQSEGDKDWYGTESYQEAEYFLVNGEHELATEMRNKMNNVSVKNDGYFRNSVTQTRLQRGAVGYRTNIGAYISGSKKCMLRKVRQRVQYPVINILYNNGGTSDITARELINTSSRVLRAIQMLELNKGIRVNLYVSELSCSTRDSTQMAGPIVRIKDSDTIMDTEKIAYPMISPSMLRRQKFRFFEVYEGLPSHFSNGYGRSLSNGEYLKEAAKTCNLHFDVALTYYEASKLSDERLMEKFTAIRPQD